MTDADPALQAQRARISSLLPLTVPIVVIASVSAMLGTPPLAATVLGAAGWLVALILRQPLALIAGKLTTRERTTTIVGWASGPAEELVRLALVLLVIRSSGEAIWAGIGWATIEVMLVAVNGLVIANLLTRTDEKARQAQQLLRDQGMTSQPGPGWGVLERLSATCLHVGFTLILFAEPLLVIATTIVHSVTNMLASRFGRRNVAATESVLFLESVVVLAVGLALVGPTGLIV